ncbi:uncharacterized protein LOC141904319 [Tubulanus polymorphus]|uniref:uncharacterized protein LOC141904319 n=1 Tax=Tubulanus polymorphus TaxID=672921 RepID=UPI003DA1EB24
MPKEKETLDQRRHADIDTFDTNYERILILMQEVNIAEDDATEIEARLDEMRLVHEFRETLAERIQEMRKDDDEFEKEIKDSNERRSQERIRLLKIKKYLENLNHHNTKPEQIQDTDTQKTAQLPKLKLPTFSGNYTDWTSFWETIQADVLMGKFSQITKFNYIIGQLRGNALDAVKGIHASGSNLDSLISILTDRFGQKRKIVRAYVNNLYELPPAAMNFASQSSQRQHSISTTPGRRCQRMCFNYCHINGKENPESLSRKDGHMWPSRQHHTSLHRDNLTTTTGCAAIQNKNTNIGLIEPNANRGHNHEIVSETCESLSNQTTEYTCENQSENTCENQSEYSCESNAIQAAVAPSDIVLLETGQINLENNGHKFKNANLLLDHGSMLSYIRKDIAAALGLKPRYQRSLTVNGFGGHTSKRVYDIASVGIVTTEGTIHIDVAISNEIVKPIYRKRWAECLEFPEISRLDHLADNFEAELFTVDILIGCGHLYLFLENRTENIPGGPIIQFSNLACFVYGPLYKDDHNPHAFTLTAVSDMLEIGDANQKFSDTILNEFLRNNTAEFPGHFEDQGCIEDNIFLEDYKEKIQYKDNCYYAPLPWKEDHSELQNNLTQSRYRLKQVTHRLQRLELMGAYTKVMQEHIEKNTVSEIPNPDQALLEEGCNYIPHFFIMKDSPTTPLRIVFDASALTERLFIPRAQYAGGSALTDHAVQNGCSRYDNDPSKGIVPYQHYTVIFGSTASPFTLAAVLSKHLDAHRDSWVAQDMGMKLYVDNLLSTLSKEDQVSEYFEEAMEIMQRGNFRLRQWASNSQLLMKKATNRDIHVRDTTSVPLLGMT